MITDKTHLDIISSRRIFNGPTDILRALTFTRYPWAAKMLSDMRANEWKPEEVSLLKDVGHFKDLSEGEQLAYKRGLAFLSNLDAIQVENLAENISQYVTDPDIKKCLHRQVWEEQLHVLSYSLIVETVVPDPWEVYNMSHNAPTLARKNDHILKQGNSIHLDPTPQAKIMALVSNIILEGIFFYSGFLTFYAIGNSRGTINGTVDMIRYIQRDEITHLNFFIQIYLARKEEAPEEFTLELANQCRSMFREAVELEIAWGEYLIEGGVLGLTNKIIRQRIEFLGEERAKAIGLGGIWPNAINPVAWVDKYADINSTLTSFFEAKPKGYSRKAVNWG
jgi:ribonucleoside-diphosphate reductase beta chain